jgi:VWFA-related protein
VSDRAPLRLRDRPVILVCALALVALGAAPTAQQPAGQQPASDVVRPSDQPVFRLSVSLVQLDAVVTDKHGRHVTTLGPDDFEVRQDGRRQPIVAVSYVQADEHWVDTSGLPPLPVEALKPEDARRVVVVVVDDLRMSFSSIYHARRGLTRFFEREFQSGDMGMIVTTSGAGTSRLTYSPLVLKADASRLRFSLQSLDRPDVLNAFNGFLSPTMDEYYNRTFAESSIGRIVDAIDAVRKLPGRKSVVLVSEGFEVYGLGSDNVYIREMLQRLVDRSNRAGVVLYALDPRGLVHTGPTAADGTDSAREALALAVMRSDALRNTQDGLRYVAGETGGFAVVNSNDLTGGFKRIMADQSGYYLIGYQPEAGTLHAKSDVEFRKVKIKVKVKGLKLRTRSGFYGSATE